jgi:hypothetical protein
MSPPPLVPVRMLSSLTELTLSNYQADDITTIDMILSATTTALRSLTICSRWHSHVHVHAYGQQPSATQVQPSQLLQRLCDEMMMKKIPKTVTHLQLYEMNSNDRKRLWNHEDIPHALSLFKRYHTWYKLISVMESFPQCIMPLLLRLPQLRRRRRQRRLQR